jgi:hypothetical protein
MPCYGHSSYRYLHAGADCEHNDYNNKPTDHRGVGSEITGAASAHVATQQRSDDLPSFTFRKREYPGERLPSCFDSE